jgi:NitT/TauT family transport system substrate-binding protein
MPKLIAAALAVLLCVTAGRASASEILNVAVPDRGSWDSSYTEFGIQQGFFKQEGLEVRVVYVADQAALESALLSGKADIAVGAGFADIVGAWVHGAPIKIISPEMTGAPDLYWFAKIVGPVARLADLHGQAVGYSAPGSLTHFILDTLLKEAGINDARLVTVDAAAGYPQVIDAQLAASWSKPPVNVNYLIAGEIRLLARANDSPTVRNATTRVNAANAGFLAGHRQAIIKFLKAYKKAVDWAYSDPSALDAFAALSGQSSDVVKYTVHEFSSREGAQIDQIKGEDRMLAQALAAKRIPRALTHDDIVGVYDLVAK